ncbi:hypothetical protein O9Z70_08670 [Devosia sp. YIM 151766]|uniref:hypothetical protein n=1 Tax=Devosia sp. YIM 151766 TaxID=3017325 RepID=UPI00255C49EF|nr:hypothetical protein [Devosia sp. YIM 151766]WIY51563.1 hypothetical protein O9Z70_08670 [Devosia sp. YIM 151766]
MEQNSADTAIAPPPDERARRIIVRLVQWIFVLVLLEGVLRKWAFGSFEQPLLFLRDPLMIAAIIHYVGYRGVKFSVLSFWYCIAALALLLLALLQLSTGVNVLVSLIGMRFYLLFVPLLFIIPETFNPEDIARLLRLCLWLAVPVGILVMVQFHSPVDAPINKGLGDDLEGRFTVVSGVVRPYGPFTFAQAQATFASFALATLLLTALGRNFIQAPRILLVAGGMAVLVMGALSGARSYFVSAAIIVVFAMIGSLIVGQRTGRFGGIIALFGLIAAFFVVFVAVFPDAYETMAQRQTMAGSSEGSVFERIWTILTGVTAQFERADMWGLGIGTGSNAGSFLAAGERMFLLAEGEWPRMVLELGPVFGVTFIGLRMLIVAAILLKAANGALAGNSAAMVMAGFAAPLILIAQVTGNNGMATLPWLAGGLTLALARQSLPDMAREAPAAFSRPTGPRMGRAGSP